MTIKQITVQAAISQKHAETYGWDVINSDFETMKEAIARAKYYLTKEYQLQSEYAPCLRYSQVLVNDKVIHDFFGK
jgi:hypothetical protein